MSETRSKTATVRNRFLVMLVAVATSLGLVTVVGGGQAAASIGGAQVGLEQFWVNGCGMPKVKVRAWKRKGNYKTVIMLDGMRAQYDYSGWEINTNIQEMVRSGVNVVEPIGGPASFYTNWDAPSNFNNQPFRYMWNCVITNTLIKALDRRGYRVGKSRRYAIMGLSMGGNAALTIGAQNRQHFDRAGSLSGYTWLSAPGMRTMIRLAMLDVAPRPWNVDSMWPIWGLQWFQNDPMWNIGLMHRIGQWPVRPLQRPAQRLRRPVQGVDAGVPGVHPGQGLHSGRRPAGPAVDDIRRRRHPRLGLLAGNGLEREVSRLLPLARTAGSKHLL